MHDGNLGVLNGHSAGIILKELVRRAIVTIRNERQIFDVTRKADHGGSMTDVFTSADEKAQKIYLKSLRECFPNHGIIAEEDKLRIEPRSPATGYFTVDPLDGTRAFIRRQSHGVGTMIALVEGGRVVSAYVGDVNTQEIYGYRPGSGRAHRITEFETAEALTHAARPVRQRYLLLRDPERTYATASRKLIGSFKSFEVEGGSIGIWLARLWKGEVGAALLPPGNETPWDSSPLIGISRVLGFAFCRPAANGKGWEVFEPRPQPETWRREHDLLIVHRDDLAGLADVLA